MLEQRAASWQRSLDRAYEKFEHAAGGQYPQFFTCRRMSLSKKKGTGSDPDHSFADAERLTTEHAYLWPKGSNNRNEWEVIMVAHTPSYHNILEATIVSDTFSLT